MKQDPTSAKTTSFGALPPEVQTMVAAYLIQCDLAVCVRVCQDWHTLFIPHLWRHIGHQSVDWGWSHRALWNCIKSPTYGLRTNAQHIESMEFYFETDGRKFRHFDLFHEFLECCPWSFPRLTSAKLFALRKRGDLVADFIRKGSLAGWKELSLGMFWDGDDDWTFTSAPKMVSAILGQASTLTVLRLDGGGYINSKDLQHFLCSARNLRVFHLLGDSRTSLWPDHCLQATDVVQSEWVCLDLKEFGCAIRGIPRPDISRWVDDEPGSEYTIKGSYNDSVDLQRRVYTQLARLTKLKYLSLGSPLAEYEASDYDEEAEDDLYREDSAHRQFDCLAMSLESGLDLMKGLKGLHMVVLPDMEVYIDGDEEQAWFSEHWPNALLRT